MTIRTFLAIGCFFFITLWACQQDATSTTTVSKKDAFKEKLSDFHFFEGNLADLKPSANTLPYELNTPLFTDYAQKLRFIHLPKGEKIDFKAKEVQYPIGTILIKNFFYFNDERDPSKGKKLIETRLLLKDKENWLVANYEWNEAQTDATRNYLGGKKQYEWIDKNGTTQQVNYIIPDNNDCKSCHKKNGFIIPIGPKTKNLNKSIALEDGKNINQLVYWNELSFLKNLPALNDLPQLTAWDNQNAQLADRAMAYLDVNCAHCHSQFGPATNTGLFLNSEEKSPHRIGVFKGPVSAAQGSGNLKYNIVPGDANASILVYRLKSIETGVAMPEIGRSLVHSEGVQLISDWINQMEKS